MSPPERPPSRTPQGRTVRSFLEVSFPGGVTLDMIQAMEPWAEEVEDLQRDWFNQRGTGRTPWEDVRDDWWDAHPEAEEAVRAAVSPTHPAAPEDPSSGSRPRPEVADTLREARAVLVALQEDIGGALGETQGVFGRLRPDTIERHLDEVLANAQDAGERVEGARDKVRKLQRLLEEVEDELR